MRGRRVMPTLLRSIRCGAAMPRATRPQRWWHNSICSSVPAAYPPVTPTQGCSGMDEPPFGWAPTNWIAVMPALRTYGLPARMLRASRNTSMQPWMRALPRGWNDSRKIQCRGKRSNVKVSTGYTSNEIGFGWTNAIYLKMRRSYKDAACNCGKLTNHTAQIEMGRFHLQKAPHFIYDLVSVIPAGSTNLSR